MAKRKRFRRHHNKNKKCSTNYDATSLTFKDELRNNNDSTENDKSFDNDLNLQKATFPQQTPTKNTATFHNILNTPVATQNYVFITPVNKRKSINRNKNADSFNCTNLNYLFQSDLSLENSNVIDDLSKTISPIFSRHHKISSSSSSPNLLQDATRTVVLNKRRSNSSMSKFHSPSLDNEGIKVHVSTQTQNEQHSSKLDEYFDKSNFCAVNRNICETPKLSQADLLDNHFELDLEDKISYKTPYRTANDILRTPKYSTADAKLSKILNNIQTSERIRRNAQFSRLGTTNENMAGSPCKNIYTPLNKLDKSFDGKYVSVSEMSFFSPDLYNLKSISTPIDKIHQNKFLESAAQNLIKEKEYVDNKISGKGSNFIYDSVTPKCNEKKEKNNKNGLMKSENIWLEKNNRSELLNMSRHKLNKIKTNTSRMIPKSASPIKHVVIEQSENILNVSAPRHNYLGRVRRFHTRFTRKWVFRIIDICCGFGFIIKQGFSTMFNKITTTKTPTQVNTILNNAVCHCDAYKHKIDQLTIVMCDFKHELCSLKHKLVDYKIVKHELNEIRQELINFKSTSSSVPVLPPPMTCGPAPPPPPPPPPPLPPPTVFKSVEIKTRAISNKNSKMGGSDNSRPMISLDEIKKVTLRKTSERPPLVKSSTLPLFQVKLKSTKSSRAQNQNSLHEVSTNSSNITSPHTSLIRMLTSDPNVRIKRLQRTRGLSFDNICRRGRNMSRERERFAAE